MLGSPSEELQAEFLPREVFGQQAAQFGGAEVFQALEQGEVRGGHGAYDRRFKPC